MGEEMHADEQSFSDLLEACSQHIGNQGKRPRTVTSNGQNRPNRGSMPRSSPSWASTSSGGNDELLNMVARLSLRQEDALVQLGLDKSYIFFLQCGRGSIMPSMLAKARDWNALKQSGDVSAPLRSTLFLHCFQELAQRALKLNLEANDDALIQNLKSKGILTDELKWAYLSWDPQAQMLKPNKTPALTSEEVRTSDCTPWATQVFGPQTDEPGESPAGRCSGNPLEIGPEPSFNGGRGALPAPSEAVRMWHHAIHPLGNTTGQPSSIAVGQCNLPTIEEMIRSVLATRLTNSGTTCYVNSILMAQVWSCFMSQAFNTTIWGPWERQMLHMFVQHAGDVVDPCDDSCLGRFLKDWYAQHPVHDQQDAGEFAGWFRQKLLEKTMPLYMQAGWSSRTDTSIEEYASVFAPIPLACPSHGFTTLQQLIQIWHQQAFVHAFSHDSPRICLQISRFP